MPEVSKPAEKAKESNPKETLSKADIENFEWLQYQDTNNQRNKVVNTLLQNPLVPLGAGATVIALVCGLFYMRKQDSAKQQFFMRCRVGAQGFTIASLLGGLFYQSHQKEKEVNNTFNQVQTP